MICFYPCSIKSLNFCNTSLMKYDVQKRNQNKKVQLYKINTYLGKRPRCKSFSRWFHLLACLTWSAISIQPIKKIPGNPRIACSYLLAISDDLKKNPKALQIFFSLVPNLLACRSDHKSLQIFVHACSIFSLAKSDHLEPKKNPTLQVLFSLVPFSC